MPVVIHPTASQIYGALSGLVLTISTPSRQLVAMPLARPGPPVNQVKSLVIGATHPLPGKVSDVSSKSQIRVDICETDIISK